jgi:hypothetical protein
MDADGDELVAFVDGPVTVAVGLNGDVMLGELSGYSRTDLRALFSVAALMRCARLLCSWLMGWGMVLKVLSSG